MPHGGRLTSCNFKVAGAWAKAVSVSMELTEDEVLEMSMKWVW